MIAILDYDAGNLRSVEKVLSFLGEKSAVTRDRREVRRADRLILPGVGSFGMAMEQLRKYEIDKMIAEAVEEGKPLLGICLGLQLLFEESEESPGAEGLCLLKGRIRKIPDAQGLKIPHIGWNSLRLSGDGRLFEGIKGEPYAYFVHSYYLKAEDDAIVRATTEYGVEIHASVESKNVLGCQFHPEKSSEAGLLMLSNFAKLKKGSG